MNKVINAIDDLEPFDISTLTIKQIGKYLNYKIFSLNEISRATGISRYSLQRFKSNPKLMLYTQLNIVIMIANYFEDLRKKGVDLDHEDNIKIQIQIENNKRTITYV